MICLNPNHANKLKKKKSNTTVKLLRVNFIDLWTYPLEIHIMLFEFCVV